MENVAQNPAIETLRELAAAQYPSKNSAGDGFSVGEVSDSLADAIAREGWALLWNPRENDALSIARRPNGSYVAVGDADGPWGVDLHLYEIVSGEGEGEGHVEEYNGPLTASAIKARLETERCGGDRWAFARPAGSTMHEERLDY